MYTPTITAVIDFEEEERLDRSTISPFTQCHHSGGASKKFVRLVLLFFVYVFTICVVCECKIEVLATTSQQNQIVSASFVLAARISKPLLQCSTSLRRRVLFASRGQFVFGTNYSSLVMSALSNVLRLVVYYGAEWNAALVDWCQNS